MSLRLPNNVFRVSARTNVCRRYVQQVWQPRPSGRSFTNHLAAQSAVVPSPPCLKAGYFLSNSLFEALQDPDSRRSATFTTTTTGVVAGAYHEQTAATISTQDLPHRRRQSSQRRASSRLPSDAAAPSSDNGVLPNNASSILTDASTRQPPNSLRRMVSLLLSLTKPRLTTVVVLSAMAPYALYPVPDFLSPTLTGDMPSLSPLTLSFLTTGTALCCASANSFNMLYESKWDAMMSRTRNRPLVRGLLSQRTAIMFAVMTGLVGIGALYFGVNPTVAFLGGANIVLYAGVYTPMKRFHWLNTWVGAIVGGIPPLMGWAAAAGESATNKGDFKELLFTKEAAGGWLFAALLFAWQLSHFMALSSFIRDEYKHAGYQMLSWVNPARNGRVALRYSLTFIPICVGLCAVGVTDWSFAVTSLPVNVWLVRESVKFWKYEGHKGSARSLFWASVWHLPVVLVLALVQKRGMWARVWRAVVGEPEDAENEWYDDEEPA